MSQKDNQKPPEGEPCWHAHNPNGLGMPNATDIMGACTEGHKHEITLQRARVPLPPNFLMQYHRSNSPQWQQPQSNTGPASH